ncbi:MAG: DUF3298 domain-containing protein [Hyphomonadaceae bacterium]|nr:DUF3298 domain-containing protein [Hyphomonadaceae bacterium]
MSARGIALLGVSIVSLALSACGDRGDTKTDQSSAARVAAALDVCASGNDEFDRSVCANGALSALETQIRETLVAESASVSDAGAELLVQNQRRWREAARVMCGVIDAQAAPSAEQEACLEGEFRSRLQAAASSVQQMGGYTFQRMELVDAVPVTAEVASASGLGDEAPPAISRDIRFPRIDGPQTPEIQRFNELVARQPQRSLGEATNEAVDYTIAFAGPELISVRFVMSEDTLGAAHPNNSERAVTVVMSEGRALTEADVFRPGSDWQNFLTRRAVTEITRQYREYDFTPPERDVRESATKPHLWIITESGLTILFPPYSFGGPHVLGGTEVSIPWADLRPYLNPAAPAPIRPSA